MEYTNLEPKQLENIALSFSGGGFRAASFSLGCLSYMETVQIGDKKLTDLIHFISSASGGTITNLAYTSSQRNGKAFDEFYKQLNEQFLNGTALVDRVFEIMKSKDIWKSRPLKSKNFINAFSMAYDEMLFKGATFGKYFEKQNGVVAEVCANTTEFNNGMIFRFQNAGDFGNKFLYFTKTNWQSVVLSKIKLADILACSSCFPVGFEPFMFPVDFTSEALTKEELEKSIQQDSTFSSAKGEQDDDKPARFGIMDGGIDDNQGIESFMRAEERLQNKNKFGHDLYICCDVSSNYTTRYDFPAENKKNWFEKLSLFHYFLVLLVLFGLSLAGIINNIVKEWAFAMLGISSFLLIITSVVAYYGFHASQKAHKTKNTYGLLIFKHIFFFLKLRLSVLLQILDSRATSGADLAAVVFLKKIRRISYDRLFEKISERKFKADGTEIKGMGNGILPARIELKHWRQFSLQNAIYLLSQKNNKQREKDLASEPWYSKQPFVNINGKLILLQDVMLPSQSLQEVADLSTAMDTTLWFDKNHVSTNKPAALIATGQFTSCYNLLRYTFRFVSDAFWQPIQENLLTDWISFCKNPYWLYDEYNDK